MIITSSGCGFWSSNPGEAFGTFKVCVFIHVTEEEPGRVCFMTCLIRSGQTVYIRPTWYAPQTGWISHEREWCCAGNGAFRNKLYARPPRRWKLGVAARVLRSRIKTDFPSQDKVRVARDMLCSERGRSSTSPNSGKHFIFPTQACPVVSPLKHGYGNAARAVRQDRLLGYSQSGGLTLSRHHESHCTVRTLQNAMRNFAA